MDNKTFIPLHALSRRLGLPAAWIKAEAEAGRIPSLRAGRRLMFNPDAVERILIERAKAAGESAKGVDRD
jgi:hypothetical protein